MSREPDLEILEVIHSTPSETLHGHFRVDPRENGVLGLIGWAVGDRSPVTQIEVRSEGTAIASAAPGLQRPDIASAFRDRPDARTCGFEIVIEAMGSGESHLTIDAQLEDGTAAPMGELRVKAPRRRWMDVFRSG
jgi:hypothetical protein